MLMEHARAGKERRETGDFIGAEAVIKHLKDGPPKRRVGLVVEGAPARRRFPTFSSAQALKYSGFLYHRGRQDI